MSNDSKTREHILAEIIIDTIWMARRYADNRSTFAPTIVNMAIDKFTELMGDKIHEDIDIGKYARDRDLGFWNSKEQKFAKE